MKEYKVIVPKLGWTNTSEKLEDLLNLHAKQGWELQSVNQNALGEYLNVIFERNKNR